jgi:anti-anti-sigma regulatory factor
MLKISVFDRRTQRQLVVEGQLIAPWVSEVLRATKGALERLDGRELVIDLNNVTLISAQGEEVLLQLLKEGVRFRCSGVYVKHVLTRLSRQFSQEAQK